MSTITREQLIIQAQEDVAKWRDAMKHNVNTEYAAIRLRLAGIALASLEAEAAGYVDAEYAELLRSKHIESCSVYAEPGEGCCPVYTAPPAPVSMPDRSMFEKWWESEHGSPLDSWDSLRTTDGYCDDGIDGQFEAWNACRAAILQGADGI